jgi:hypothetical protein
MIAAEITANMPTLGSFRDLDQCDGEGMIDQSPPRTRQRQRGESDRLNDRIETKMQRSVLDCLTEAARAREAVATERRNFRA